VVRRVDTVAGLCALALHAGVALVLVTMPPPRARSATTVEIEIKKTPPKPPEPVTAPEPPPPEPERKVVPKVKPQAVPTPSPLPPKENPEPPPKEPVKPVYEVKEVMEGGDSNVEVQHGDNGYKLANPNQNPPGPSKPLPAGNGAGPAQPAYKPVSDLYVKKLPEIDNEACGRMVQYPSEAQEAGVEGDVELRVALDESGKVHDIKVIKGLGHGLDEAAVHALKYKCHFTPAIGTDGKPVAYVISKYTWNFELPR